MSLRKRNQTPNNKSQGHDRASKRSKSTRNTGLGWGRNDEVVADPSNADQDSIGTIEDSQVAAAKLVREENEERETVADKRRRLAKAYLQQLDAADEADAPLDVQTTLQDDQLRAAGRLQRKLAAGLVDAKFSVRRYRGHKLPATCVTITPDNRYGFTGSKDGSIIRWDLKTGERLFTVSKKTVATAKRLAKEAKISRHNEDVEKKETIVVKKSKFEEFHTGAVLALSVCPDGKFLVSGGVDKLIRVWNVRVKKKGFLEKNNNNSTVDEPNHVNTSNKKSKNNPNNQNNPNAFKFIDGLSGHRDTISGLCFRDSNSPTLYSASHDRTVKLWTVDELAYMETLFGHQAEVNGVASLRRERCVTVGTFYMNF